MHKHISYICNSNILQPAIRISRSQKRTNKLLATAERPRPTPRFISNHVDKENSLQLTKKFLKYHQD